MESPKSSGIPTTKDNKKVHFAPLAKFKRVRPHYHYTKDEHDASWYSESELRAIVEDCIKTCKMMIDGELVLEEEGYCTRGLEGKVAALSAPSYRTINKARAIRVVVQERKTQESMGVHQPEYLATLYAKVTRETRRMAHLTALRDQEVASQIHAPMTSSSLASALTRDKKLSDHRVPEPTSPVSDSDSSVSWSRTYAP